MSFARRAAVLAAVLLFLTGLAVPAAASANSQLCVYSADNYTGSSYCWGSEWYNRVIPVQTVWAPESYINNQIAYRGIYNGAPSGGFCTSAGYFGIQYRHPDLDAIYWGGSPYYYRIRCIDNRL